MRLVSPYLAPMAKESDIIDPSRLGALGRWEEQGDGRHVGELGGPARKRLLGT